MSAVVEVNEVAVFANGAGARWWALYRLRYRDTDRVTEVVEGVIGAVCHVACDSRDDAEWLAAHMVDHGGLPRTAVKVRSVRTDVGKDGRG